MLRPFRRSSGICWCLIPSWRCPRQSGKALSDKFTIPFDRVVVLGSTGFLGKKVCDVFRQSGVDIIGLRSKDVDLRKEASIAALQQLAGGDVALIFSSALTPDRGQTLGTLSDNLTMAINVGKFLESCKIGLCVNISSDAVYPLTANPITENSPIDPAGYYGLAKYGGEKILERVTAASKIDFLNLRVTALYGPGDPHGSYGPNSFLKSLMKDKTVRLFGAGEEKRDHLHVDDAVFLIRKLMAVRATGTYNLATGRSRSFSDIVTALQQAVPFSFEVVSMARRGPITHRHFDTTRLCLQVPGFQFASIEEGIAGYYRFCFPGT
ncbi:MAG: NAD(P)-dependent oxidoreductase [Nitrospira sp.]|nr:MAG: NAD(P)-dependent oxidoreductase [Nitrospira sp.]